jgi:hypothetical protein
VELGTGGNPRVIVGLENILGRQGRVDPARDRQHAGALRIDHLIE